jgi:hypothetical protein
MASELYSAFGSSMQDSGAVYRKMIDLFKHAINGSLEFMDFQRSDARMQLVTFYDVLQAIGMKSSLAVAEQAQLVLKIGEALFIGLGRGDYAEQYMNGRELSTPKEAAYQLNMILAALSGSIGKESENQHPGNESAAYQMQKAIRHYELAAWHGKASTGMNGDLLPLHDGLKQHDLLLDSVVSIAYGAEKKDMPDHLESILESVKKTHDHWALVRALGLIGKLMEQEPSDISLQKAAQQVKSRLESALR